MREIKVYYDLENAEVIKGIKPESNEGFCSEFTEASSSEEAIGFVKDYLIDQIINNTIFTVEEFDGGFDVIDDLNEEIVERYFHFFAESPVEKLLEEIGMSEYEAAMMLEMPVETLMEWESEHYTPPHWAEKLVLEKLESIRKAK